MWSDSDGERELKAHEVAPGRDSTSSEIVVMDEGTMAAAENLPTISQLNVSQKSKVHVGPKFVSVTQNVHNAEMVKTRFLGLELISAKNTLRCSIAVFVCWTFVVAIGLAFYLIQYALPMTQTRLDLDLPLPCYLWNIIKSTSNVERMWCAAGLSVLVVCLTLIVYFTKTTEIVDDDSPHEWNITRRMWLAAKYENEQETTPYEPLRLVVVQHTASQECRIFTNCAAELRNLQAWNIKNCPCDIAYNFLIGNDGRVYEGRGWKKVGAHTRFFNLCSLGLGFIGDYREYITGHSSISKQQVNRTTMLLDYGVKQGYLHPDYQVLAAKDIQATESPGSNLYNELKTWKHYNNGSAYDSAVTKEHTCDLIYAQFRD